MVLLSILNPRGFAGNLPEEVARILFLKLGEEDPGKTMGLTMFSGRTA